VKPGKKLGQDRLVGEKGQRGLSCGIPSLAAARYNSDEKI
jgi:hypothetical protein